MKPDLDHDDEISSFFLHHDSLAIRSPEAVRILHKESVDTDSSHQDFLQRLYSTLQRPRLAREKKSRRKKRRVTLCRREPMGGSLQKRFTRTTVSFHSVLRDSLRISRVLTKVLAHVLLQRRYPSFFFFSRDSLALFIIKVDFMSGILGETSSMSKETGLYSFMEDSARSCLFVLSFSFECSFFSSGIPRRVI